LILWKEEKVIKIILGFLIVFAGFFIGIAAFRNLSGKEKWQLTKLVIYSIICAVLTTLALTVFYITF
jgi:divalent metal cation (Fe/Co/Zn/Cd) transporter